MLEEVRGVRHSLKLVTGGCVPPEVGARNRARVPCKEQCRLLTVEPSQKLLMV